MINRKKILCLLLLATLALQIPLSKAQDQELLPPAEAFNLTAWIDGDELVAEYKIATGYYMYRKRFDFTVESSDAPVRFDQAQIPAGKLKHDEFFGETETYREQVTIRLPILFDATV
jgi:thiol:disulfide interchange protein DsbD